MFFLFFLAGFAGGFIGGMGMGGGSILVPILSLFKVGQKTCQCINLVSFVPMAGASLFLLLKKNLIQKDLLFVTTLFAFISSVAGSLVAFCLDKVILKKLFGYFLISASVVYSIKLFIDKNKSKNKEK